MRVAASVLIFIVLFIMPVVAQETGTITGVVLSIGSQAVPDATVTLYDEYGSLVNVPDNPQQSSGGFGSNAGIYTFYDVPLGVYNVTAEKNGVFFFAIADLSGGGTATANVMLPEYIEAGPISPPSTPRPFTYFLPVRLGKAAPTETPGAGLAIALAVTGGLCVLALYAGRRE